MFLSTKPLFFVSLPQLTRLGATIACLLLLGLTLWHQPVTADEFEGSITGRVVTRDKSKPVFGAVVKARSQATGSETEVTTDESGAFKLTGLRPGTYVVSVTAEKYEPARLTTLPIVSAGQTTTIRDPIKLEPERAVSIIRGAVFDERGYSMAGVKVVLESLSKDGKTTTGKVGEYTTNSGGEFAFRLPGAAANYRVTASSKGFKLKTQDVDVQKNEARNIAVTMEKQP